MPRWTPDELAAYEARRHSARAARLPAADSKPVEGNALERAVSGKAQGSTRFARVLKDSHTGRVRGRSRIVFTIYSQRPCDYDNYHIKEIQDCLVRAGILDGDEWDVLQGEIVSAKAHTKEEVRTEITITPL